MIEVTNVCKQVITTEGKLDILDGISLTVADGETLAIVGPSGSGKSTLLGILAGLDLPSSGSVVVNNQDITAMDEEGRAMVRAKDVGFVFQSFHLLARSSALDNVMLPLEISGSDDAQSKAKEALIKVGLEKRVQHFPTQLSGGEKQRVAIARAMVNEPKILFADEPTGNLDKKSSSAITDLLFSVNEQMQTTLVLVTHDLVLAEKCEKVYELSEGRLL